MKTAFTIALLLLLCGCNGKTSPITEEPKIYRALLIHLEAEKAESLTIRAESVSDRVRNDGFDELKIDGSDIKQSFTHINSTSSLVPLSGVTFNNVTIVSKHELEGIFRTKSLEQDWKKFYEKYPKSTGIIGLSRVGFNEEVTKAVVYIERSCGKLCGNGYIVYLEKGLSGWKVKHMVQLWVS